ncbi:glycosyl hydrolase family 20, catalytic domain protein [Pseudoflavonifractor capillosus ATCC 29799]|uniref:Glycosyl hydrolase family 20, catalytic domain protein n=1 Tax=Pseudoflavonifractor capillosus ATCC 29799 TaxID=411467 RepID=A6NPT1_9FIRM|nr:family 20 glycosylhydrolase [Pseudoflavonifractor capillosus]EDN01856.1 glycosyl hydrolase family 20, catalytic domain protein [Pseudoflavonifractor capillosus ATCC 29799]
MKKAVRKGASKAVALVLSLAMIFGMAPMVSASAGNTADAQDNFDRIVHLDMGRKYFTPDWIKSLIDEMAKLGYNQLELDFGNSEKGQLRFALEDMSVNYTYTEQTMVPVDNTDAQEEPAAPVETGEPVEEQPAAPVQTEEPADEEQTAETVMPLQEEPAAPAETVAPTAPVTDEVLEQAEESGAANGVIVYNYIDVPTTKTVYLNAALPADGEYITESEMKGIIAHAKDKGIEIVPLLNSPGHFGAVLDGVRDENGAPVNFSYNNSNSLDITNEEAVAFGQAVVLKYAEWFKGQGCDTFNIGADEFANDIYPSGGMGFGHLVWTQQYHHFVDYVNTLADKLQEMGYTVRAFNDGINYGGQTGVENDIQVCYWTSGWPGYNVASASALAAQGFTMINTHGDYYYVLGKNSAMTEGKIDAADFDAASFIDGSVIAEPAGAMFCIWSDYPDAQTQDEVMNGALPYMTGFASALGGGAATDAETNVSVEAPGVVAVNATATSNVPTEISSGNGKNDVKFLAYTAYDIQVNDGTYTDEAQVTLPLPQSMQGYEDSQLMGFVVNENGSYTLIPGSKNGTNYTFTMPHFSVGGVVAYAVDDTVKYEQVTGSVTAGTYMVVYKNNNRYYAMDQDGNAVQLTANSDGTLSTGSNDAGTLLWTFAQSGNNWTLTDAAGQKLGITAKRPIFQNWSVTVNFSGGGQQQSFSISENGNAYSIRSAEEFDADGIGSSFAYVIGGTSRFSGSTDSSTLYLYREATPTYIVTIHTYKDGTSTPVGNGTYTEALPAGTQTISAPSIQGYSPTQASQTIEVSPLSENTLTFYYVEKQEIATAEEIEFWITNAPVTAGNQQRMTLNTDTVPAAIFSDDGVALEDLVPYEGVGNGETVAYWKGTLLPYNRSLTFNGQQTGDGGNDQTMRSDRYDFSKIKYSTSEDAWYVYGTSGWRKVQSTDQLVAYYLQVTELTNALQTHIKDWGGVKGKDPYGGFGWRSSWALSVAVVYDTGMVPAEENLVNTSTFYNGDAGRHVGYLKFLENEDYEVAYITATFGKRTGSDKDNINVNYDLENATETRIWDAENDSMNDRVNGYPYVWGGGQFNNVLTWSYSSNWYGIVDHSAILIRIYVKERVKEDSLTIRYVDDTAGGTQFYETYVNVNEGVNFEGYVGSDGSLLKDTITNSKGDEQPIVTNLDGLTYIPDKYRSGLYEYTKASLGEDNKTLVLHYTLKLTAHNFVVDFGLPMVINALDLGITTGDVTSFTVNADSQNQGLTADGATLTFVAPNMQYTTTLFRVTAHFSSGATQELVIRIYPASTMYYEAENFVYFEDAAGMKWAAAGTSSNRTQAAEKLGAKENNYGSDPAYNSKDLTWSNENAKKVTVSEAAFGESGEWPTATFTFTGTGADIISQTDAQAGVILVDVKQGTKAVKSYIVNNYYGYTYSDTGWTVSADNNGNDINSIYQVPVIAIRDLEYDTYTVTITVAYDKAFDVTYVEDGPNSFDFYLDAIRVYNPLESSSVYAADKESDPIFNVLHNLVTNFGDTGTLVDGLMEADKEQFEYFGPNNEIYLAPDQTVTVTLKDTASGKNAQIAARLIAGESASLDIGGKSVAVNSTVDQYYTINGGITGSEVTITNNGQGTVALTILKLTGGSN